MLHKYFYKNPPDDFALLFRIRHALESHEEFLRSIYKFHFQTKAFEL